MFERNWSHKLFVENAELFLPILEAESKHAGSEVAGLSRILRDLNVPNNSKILDLSCGIGRHSILLAKRGFRVIGYDPSAYFLNIANKKAKLEPSHVNERLHFYQGDPGQPSIELLKMDERNFDVIISLFQSLGYISRKYDILMLKDLIKIASPKCHLILETENKKWRIRNFESSMINNYKSICISEVWKFDSKENIFKNKTKFFTHTRDDCYAKLVLDLKTHMILYSLTDLKEVTATAGWKYIKSYDSIRSLAPARADSKMPVSIYKIKSPELIP